MAWGYVVRLEIKVPVNAMRDWEGYTPGEFLLPDDWPSKALAAAFTPKTELTDSFKRCILYKEWPKKALLEKDDTHIYVTIEAALDEGKLHLAGILPAMLLGAQRFEGSGELVIVANGAAPEDGFRCTVDDRTLVTKKLTAAERKTLGAKLGAK